MKLSIIITHYKEPVEVCIPMWNSLAFQLAYNKEDLEIIWVQDGEEGEISTVMLEGMLGIEIKHLDLPHGGISKARNEGVKAATGDYVMFCDCDDQFQHAFGLHLLFSAMAKEPDIIGSKFTEENRIVSDYAILPRDNDMTFVHGKAFRREFLLQNHLEFHEDLTKHEDGVFVFTCYKTAKTTQYIHTPFYLWRWNPNSVMRSIGAKHALLFTYPDVIKARATLMEDLQERGHDIEMLVAKAIMDAYYDFQKDEFNDPDLKSYRDKAIEATSKFYRKYKKLYYKNTGDVLAEIMAQCRNNAYQNGMKAERVTLPQFITELKEFK